MRFGGWSSRGESPNCVIYVSASGHLAGPARSLATVIRTGSESALRQVLIAPGGDLLTETATIPGLVQVELPLERRFRKLYRLSGSLMIVRQAWKYRRSLVAIHANGLSELNLAGPAAMLIRRHVVVWSHASVIAGWAPRLARLWPRAIRALHWAAVSPEASQALVTGRVAPLDQITIIPNPISADDVVVRHTNHKGPIRIGYLSEPSRSKGFDVLVEAVSVLAESDVEWWLFTNLAGKRADADLVHAASQFGNVRAMGRVSDVSSAYSQIDVVFVPSRRESFGRIAAEAMLNGLAVVASDIPAMRRLIGDDAGLLFPPGDAGRAAQQIARIVADPELRHRLGQAGPERVREFDPVAIRGALEHLYRVQRS